GVFRKYSAKNLTELFAHRSSIELISRGTSESVELGRLLGVNRTPKAFGISFYKTPEVFVEIVVLRFF
ncbi:MAG: hypothetical protein O7D30_01480, partial [Rickettsia endosymbiont of Ixodes persulcatus]|nr:hypothetical protein [Rickettsia endosymbiont of Ixodes persulcatus]